MQNKTLKVKVEEAQESRNDAKKAYLNIEKENQFVQRQLSDANGQIHDLEQQLNASEQNAHSLQGNNNYNQLTFTCSKSAIQTLEKGVKLVLLWLTLNTFCSFF